MNVLRSIYSVFFLSFLLSMGSLFGMMSSRSLILAVKKGDIKAAQQALDKGADANAKEIFSIARKTALMLAVGQNDKPMAELLIKAGAHLNARTWQGKTPLIIAVEKGLLDMVKLLLERGADPTIIISGISALSLAVAKGDEPMARLLMNAGTFDPNHEIVVQNRAVREGYPKIVRLFMRGEQSANVLDKILLAAINANDIQEAKKALEEGAYVDAQYYVAGKMLLLKDPLKNPAYFDAQLYFGKISALLLAIIKKNPEMVELLIENKATYEPGFLLMALIYGNFSVAKVIFDRGYGTLSERRIYRMRSGMTIRNVLKGFGGTNLLLGLKEIISSKFLHRAAAEGSIRKVRLSLLLTLNQNINARNYFLLTPLMQAAGNGHLPVVDLLIQKGAKVNLQDTYGKTALMIATEKGFDQIVKLLLENGADQSLKDIYGTTVYNYAVDHPKVLKVLNEFSVKIGANLLAARRQALKQEEEGETPDSLLGLLPREILLKEILPEVIKGPPSGPRERGVTEWLKTHPEGMTVEEENERRRRLDALAGVGAGAGADF